MKECLVVTTINVPSLLRDYAENFVKYGHQREAEILVIGDLKTPGRVVQLVGEIRSLGVAADFIDIPAQEAWLEKFPALKKIIPYNSDNRRNLGYLMAVERGADIVICLDDDNHVDPSQDFLEGHSIVGRTITFEALRTNSEWFNVCSMLRTEPQRPIYARGFPYSKRWRDGSPQYRRAQGRIVINEGLWLGDPDIDSITRLTEDVKTTAVLHERVILDKGTYSPINTQNTAFHKDVLPCAYFVLMGEPLSGLAIDRYGDIWFGLFAKKIIDHMGEYVSFGKPFTSHRRNQHDLFKDLQQELRAIILTDILVELLETTSLTETTYGGCYGELAERLGKFAAVRMDIDDECRSYLFKIKSAMKIWADTCIALL